MRRDTKRRERERERERERNRLQRFTLPEVSYAVTHTHHIIAMNDSTFGLRCSSIPVVEDERGEEEEEELIMHVAKEGDSGWKFPIDVFLERKTTDEELQGLRKRYSRNKNSWATNKLIRYYEKRNYVIESLAEAELMQEGKNPKEKKDSNELGSSAHYLVRLSLWVNILLLCMKAPVAVLSGSLAIITSALDSLLDITSGTILYITNRAMNRPNKYKYPVGKARMEPLGIIVFSSMMGTIGFTVLVEAVRQFMGEKHIHHLEHLNVLLSFMALTIFAKLILFVFCKGNEDNTVRVLAADHFSDVCTNSASILGAILGDRVVFWMDPLAAILLAAYISKVWGQTAYDNIMAMVGLSADPSYSQKLTYLSYNHHPGIIQVDTVRSVLLSFPRQSVYLFFFLLLLEIKIKTNELTNKTFIRFA